MLAGKEFIESYLEHRVYDPSKAHDYYEKHKQLKGRKPGSSPTPTGGGKTKTGSTPAVKSPVQAQADAHVAALNIRLDRLRKILAELVKKAQDRGTTAKPAPTTTSTASKSKTSKTAASKSASTKSGGTKKSSAQDKAKAHSYYQSHKSRLKSKEAAAAQEKIAGVRKQIQAILEQLKAAQAGSKNPPPTAPKGR